MEHISGLLGVTRPSRWYALQVKQRHERITATILNNKGYREFVPMYRVRRRWSDRTVELDLPLFPGYVFCHFNLDDRRVPVVTTPGIIRVIGVGPVAVPIDDAEIANIQSVVQSGTHAQPWPFLQIGDKVRIEYGALAGIEGILTERKKRSWLVLSIALLQRSVAVEIDASYVTLVHRSPRAACEVRSRR